MAVTPSIQLKSQVLTMTLQTVTPVLRLLTEAFRRWQIRRSYGSLSEAGLRDIGLTPHDLAAALARPLTNSASNALADAVAGTQAKW